MSAHHRHQHLITPPITPAAQVSHPHTSNVSSTASPLEILLLLLCTCVLITLLCWLTYICLKSCLRLTVEERDDHEPSPVLKSLRDMGVIAKETVTGLRWKRDKFHEAGEEGRYGLLAERDGRWYDALRRCSAERKERVDADGTSDSTDTGVTVVHREDCEGVCGQGARRRSGGP